MDASSADNSSLSGICWPRAGLRVIERAKADWYTARWTLSMEGTRSNRYARLAPIAKERTADFEKMMLQTAPVLLFFHPTVGPNAKLDSQPVRYDFTTG